jgi:hypothetical protein
MLKALVVLAFLVSSALNILSYYAYEVPLVTSTFSSGSHISLLLFKMQIRLWSLRYVNYKTLVGGVLPSIPCTKHMPPLVSTSKFSQTEW